MTDYLQRALQQLGAAEGEVLAHSVNDTEIVIVLDKGIQGCPKYRIPLDKLAEPVEVVEEDEPEETPEYPPPQDVVGASYLESYSYRALQAEAKRLDIPANQTKEDLLAAITEAVDVE